MDVSHTNGHANDANGLTNGHHDSSSTSTPLRIVIVGAGIGGLSAAIFLRQQGHHVTLLEQSRFANELGAAVHLAPNANGLLRRLGLWAEDIGANPTTRMTQYLPNGNVMFSGDLTTQNKIWQHPWLLAHRVHLHSELKKRATATEGKGRPATLRTSSKVASVTIDGKITLASGEQIHADVIVGADGVHSKSRYALPGSENIKVLGSGKSAFRFLMPRERATADPVVAKYGKNEGELQMFMGRDRRVVIYPTSNNTLLNFVCIHPTVESEVRGDGDWNQVAHKDKMLEVYKDFDPALLKLLAMADDDTLKVWELLDMPQLPTWTDGRLVLIGDAAHPFTPHQGQGAGQAIEDAASLAIVLPLGTPVAEVSERLKLYEKCRYERASRIQEYSRQSGKDLGDGPPLDVNAYVGYNFGHDEWDHTSQVFRRWQWNRNPNLYWRMPISFGPMPGPRQEFGGNARDGTAATFSTASIRFKTSKTLLQSLLPADAYSFTGLGTVVEASFSVTTLDNLGWLGGRGYSHFGLYIHGVQYKKVNGKIVQGTYLPILFENLADPILSGREELGMPKLFCDLSVKKEGDSSRMEAGWMGSKFCDITLDGFQGHVEQARAGENGQAPSQQKNEGLLWHKYVPKTGPRGSKERGTADVSHAVFLPNEEEAKTVEKKIVKTVKADTADIRFDALDWKKLPTLHHIVDRLAEIPIYEVVEAKLVEGTGVSDVSAARALV
ncbi:hypothetical protein BDV96DRAFT_601233 [Lophiotrema nucula]|uniref:FAD-binding domain-containing protein n=1 Tax=Lophiotrema nucula TaxID=690887 RepID=A0A6A5Z3W5_9PLEO|nr:hypothetical protein BDV96DRAFT_601233 [Lophiotrema nucula]